MKIKFLTLSSLHPFSYLFAGEETNKESFVGHKQQGPYIGLALLKRNLLLLN